MPGLHRESFLLRYGLALVAVAVATVLTHVLGGVGDFGISPLFFAAVLIAAWYGGVGPGLLATLLSALATSYLLTRPHTLSLASLRGHVPRIAMFTTVSLLAGALHAATRRAAEASRRAREAAESANAAKSRFLALVSHELRTPLSPVMLTAEFLETDPRLPEELKADVRRIRRNVGLEIRLIDDLVDLSRVSAGKMSLRREPLDLHEPIRAAIEVCRADAAEKQITLDPDLAAPNPMVLGDSIRLQQVAWNLLRNAIKFTPERGRITIATANTDVAVELRVSDNGIGIPPERLERIFEAFEQGGDQIQDEFGGLGLGLAICKALVEAHGGRVTAQSPGSGRGATFTVKLPVEAPQVGNESLLRVGQNQPVKTE